jgi:type IV pilus assembly protein PilB
MAVVTDKLGRLLIEAHLITEQQLQEALAVHKQKGGGRLVSTLVKMGFIEEEKLLGFLARQYRLPSVSLTAHQHIDPALIKLVPLELVKKHLVLPLKRVGATLTVALCDPTNLFALDDLKFWTNYTIEPVLTGESALLEAIKKYYGGGGNAQAVSAKILEARDYTISDIPVEADDLTALGKQEETLTVEVEDFDKTVGEALDSVEVGEEQQEGGLITGVEATIVKLVNAILVNAMKVGASDIHVEPYERAFRVRYRIDGDLQTIMSLPLKVKNAILSRIKIMAKLDIAERRLPQDGRIKLRVGPKRDIDFRVSILPTLSAKKAVFAFWIRPVSWPTWTSLA